jgi:uncharacterized cupredoxin-like copper-binding protein
VLVEALSTGHKVGLAVVGAVFIVFALSSAFLFPRLRSTFPGRGLPAFIIVALVFFFGMLTAVEVFGAEPKEKGATHEAGSTTAPTQSTTTVAIPPPTTTTTASTTTSTKPTAKPQTISATETEFKIVLSTTTVKAGPVTIEVKNAGKIQHDLIVNGQGITSGTPRLNGGQSKSLNVTLKPGTYDVFCSVPGHKQLGMDAKLTVTKSSTTTKAPPKTKPATKPQTVNATETEFKIVLSTTTVKAGPVTIEVKNAGKIQHDLIVRANR